MMGYMNQVPDGLSNINEISLEYAAATPAGWIAYNKECNLYNYWNTQLITIYFNWMEKFTPESDQGVKYIHNKLLDNPRDSVWIRKDKLKPMYLKYLQKKKAKKGGALNKSKKPYFEIMKALDKYDTF
jgi:hypothetical protein